MSTKNKRRFLKWLLKEPSHDLLLEYYAKHKAWSVTELQFSRNIDEALGLTDLENTVKSTLANIVAAIKLAIVAVPFLMKEWKFKSLKLPDIKFPTISYPSAVLRLSTPALGVAPVMPIVQSSGRQAFVVTSQFGARKAVRTTNGSMPSSDHKGIDISGSTSDKLVATESGKVVLVKSSPKGYGNHVVIEYPRSGSKIRVLYAHMSRISVTEGQSVSSGTEVGYVGSSGNSTGPHLHMEVQVFKDGRAYNVNPLDYIRQLSSMGAHGSFVDKNGVDNLIYNTTNVDKTKTTASYNLPAPIPTYTAPANAVKFESGTGISLPGVVTGKGKNRRYQMKGISYKYSSSHGRDERYHNPMNVKGSNYEGQVGTDEWYMVNQLGGQYADSKRWHAAFSDPFYSIKAAMADTSICVNWNPSRFTMKALGDRNPALYGFKEPQEGRNLYMMCCRYSPVRYNKQGPAQGYNSWPGHCGPLSRAQKIVAQDPSAWPLGVDTVYDFSRSKGQFKSFVKQTLIGEQGVQVEDWYLDACWEAIYNGGTPPTQENLNNQVSVSASSEHVSVSQCILSQNTQRSYTGNSKS